MAEHSLPEGKRWIENLLALGRALSYQAEGEYNVAPEAEEDAPVDVAWLRSVEDEFPLFIFEVESRPSGQMAYNAAKVFAQSTDLFEKPLFHFHLVVTGGETSGRLKTSQELFGEFNYRVYRVADEVACTTALCDMLSQHRRVSDELDVRTLARALEPSRWPGLDLDVVWLHVEACGFRAQWEAAYAELAHHDPAFRGRLARRLRAVLDLAADEPLTAQYPSWLVQQCATLVHATLIASLDPSSGGDCLKMVARWQSMPPSPRIGPAYGASEEFDDLFFARMPVLWASLAAAIATTEARAFALEQMALTLGPSDQPNPPALSAIAALWMLQVARSGGDEHRVHFDRAREHLAVTGGVRGELVAAPPGRGAPMGELDSWAEDLARDADAPPDWDGFPTPSTASARAEASDQLADELVAMLAKPEPELDAKVVLAALWSTA